MKTEDYFNTNYNAVKEMILDEEKIVTYVSLSKDLCIHINESKKMLEYFVKKVVEENSNIKLNVNFILSGISDDNNARTIVCAEEELKKLKSSLKCILFEHIYSVSRGPSNIDHAAYLLLSKIDDLNLCSGMIKNSDCSKRTSEEIGSLKVVSQQISSVESKPVIPPKKIKVEAEKDSKLCKNIQTEEKKSVEATEKTQSKIKTEVISPKKDTNKNMGKNSIQKTQKGIAGFFNKPSVGGADKKVSKMCKVQPETTEPKNDIKIEKMDTDNQALESKKEVKDDQSKNKNKVLINKKKSSKVDKKRKRVLHVSDSESNDENDPFLDKQESINESDDEIPATPVVNNIKITSGIINPKKKRKIVDKTYTDEDGYILTKKEEIYESCSENEEEVSTKPISKEIKQEKVEISPKDKKNGSKANKKKISPTQKGKQATLAHFFKKL